jgi:uncharacterized protein (DUF1697 family)
MTTCVALLRGINIGAKKRIAMADLRALVADCGYGNVRTLVNSGNVVFDVDGKASNEQVAATIEAAILEKAGLNVPVVARTGAEMREIVARNPFPDVAATPKLLHVFFLAAAPESSRVEALREVERGDDDFRVIGSELYLSVPHGLSGGTLSLLNFDRALGVLTTGRNWNTVMKLAGMATER